MVRARFKCGGKIKSLSFLRPCRECLEPDLSPPTTSSEALRLGVPVSPSPWYCPGSAAEAPVPAQMRRRGGAEGVAVPGCRWPAR